MSTAQNGQTSPITETHQGTILQCREVEARLVKESITKLPQELQHSVIDAYTYGKGVTLGSAGIDLRYCGAEPLVLYPGEQELIGTGLAIHLRDPKLVGICAPRSGLGNAGLVLGNTIGVIDADYQGELKLSLLNRLPKSRLQTLEPGTWGYASDLRPITVHPGERVAQYFVVQRELLGITFVDSFSEETERGDGGFGHSGRY